LERKLLLAETGKALIVHSAENAARARGVSAVVVATDSEEIASVVRSAGLRAVMTRADHPSGTDRVWEALRALGEGFDVVLNVQGDEPELDPAWLERLTRAFDDPAVDIATLAAPILDPAQIALPSVVKVVVDRLGRALYFSRAPIPATSHARGGASDALGSWRRHVGVYAFRPSALERFCGLEPGRLEALENLEQLRWLEAGGSMRVLDVERATLGIDTRPDYDAFVGRIRGIERARSN
jgi:3-deoxy-manno-octulosonate cytidylyltransferase (CMP-KDO synthetase)